MKLIRPRILFYAAAFALVGSIMVTAWLLRPDLEVSVLRDRNPLYVKLSDGGVRNGYTVKVLNKLYAPHALVSALRVSRRGLSVVGHEKEVTPS